MILPDLEDRHAALTDFQHNLVVTAGAGTGKTALLVGRLIAALVLHHLEPHQVLPVTFTENAATEMRERLIRVLCSVEPWLAGDQIEASDAFVLDQLSIGPENVSRVQDLLADIESVAIHTFHGFCLQFLRDHARQLDLPPDLRVIERDDHFPGFEEVFHEHLRAASDGEVHPALRRFEVHDLRELTLACLELPDESLDRIDASGSPPPDLDQRLADLHEIVARYPNAPKSWQTCAASLVTCYRALLEGRDARAEFPQKKPNGGKKAENAGATEALHAHFAALRALCCADDEAIAVGLDFVRPIVGVYRQRLVQVGEVGFQDLLLLTRRCLMKSAELRASAARSMRAILVDEFQDTDPLQYDIVFLLAAESGAQAEDPMDLPLRPGTLFIVGDAKQSIYRFRRADVAAFARAVDCIDAQGGRRLELTANFRSHRPILEFVNTVCRDSLAEDRPYQFGYSPVVPMLEDEGVDVHVLTVESDEPLKSSPQRDQEGLVIVDEIRSLQAAGIGYGKIAILLRAMTETNWIVRPLRAAGIPYVLEGSRRFYKRHEIVLCGALLAAMARPYDATAVLAILRSALSAATDREILEHRLAGRKLDIACPDAEGPVGETLAMLRAWLEHVAHLPLSDALTFLLTRPELRLAEAKGFEGPQRIANIERLLHKLVDLAPLDLAEAAAAVEHDTNVETDDEESPLFDQDTDAVRLLTVHKAKGLEFPVVFLPDVARTNKNQESSDAIQVARMFDARGTESVIVRIRDSKNRAFLENLDATNRHSIAEQRRLFYVAATRAQQRLILIRSAEQGKASQLWQADLDATDPECAARGVRGDPALARGADAPFDAQPTLRALDAHRKDRAALAGAWCMETVSPSQHPADERAPETGPQQGDLFETKPKSLAKDAVPAREFGIAMHHYLALVDLSRPTPDEELLATIPEADAIRDLAASFHASDLRDRLARAEQVLREVPLSFLDENRIVNGFVDALVLAESGAPLILDWKTDEVSSADATAHAEKYREQLRTYARGVQLACELPELPRMAVHFLRADCTIEWED